MITNRALVVFLTLLGITNAYNPTPPTTTQTRRETLSKIATSTLFGIGVLQQPAQARVEACPPKSNNCVYAEWTPPSGTSKDDAVKGVLDVVNAYPQEGQADVDGGGWKIAEGTIIIEWVNFCFGLFRRIY